MIQHVHLIPGPAVPSQPSCFSSAFALVSDVAFDQDTVSIALGLGFLVSKDRFVLACPALHKYATDPSTPTRVYTAYRRVGWGYNRTAPKKPYSPIFYNPDGGTWSTTKTSAFCKQLFFLGLKVNGTIIGRLAHFGLAASHTDGCWCLDWQLEGASWSVPQRPVLISSLIEAEGALPDGTATTVHAASTLVACAAPRLTALTGHSF